MSKIHSPRLIGRREEVTALREQLLAARTGHASVVLLSGAAGLGKSRLADELVSHAQDHNVTTAVGHATPLSEGAMPLGPVAEALRRLLDQLGSRSVQTIGPDRRQIASILPELGPRADGTDPGPLFVAVRRVLSRAAEESPLLLVLEDLHWAGRQTLDLIGFLARTVDDQRLMIVATFRPAEVDDAGHAAAVGELGRLPRTTHLELSPLINDQVHELATAILGAPPPQDELRHISHLSGGNPFLIEEILAAGVTHDRPLPSSLRRVVLGRIREMAPEVRRVLDAVAVAGRATVELLEAVVDLPYGPLLDAVREARDRDVLVEQGDTFQLRHALLREALEAELLATQRRRLNERVAEALTEDATRAGDAAHGLGAELARYWHAAGRPKEAYQAACDAARKARELGANSDALPQLERALSLVDDVAPDERHVLLDETIELAADVNRSQLVVALVRQRLDNDLSIDHETRLQTLLAQHLFLGDGAPETILAASHRAVELAADASPARRAEALQVAAHTHLMLLDQDPDHAVDLAFEARRVAEGLNDPGLLHATSRRLGAVLGWVGRSDEALEVLQAAKERAIEHDVPERVASLLAQVFTQTWRRDLADGTYRTLTVVEEGLPWVERLDEAVDPGAAHELLGWAVFAYLRAGQWDRAEWAVRRFERFMLDTFHAVWRDLAWAYLLWMRGELDSAERLVRRVWTPTLNPRWYHEVMPMSAQFAAERGDLQEVRRVVQEHLDVSVHPKEESKKLATMLPLVRAEVDAALRSSGQQHQEHAARARQALEDLHRHLDRFPPPTIGSVQNEQEATTVAFADAELSRLTGGDPELWADAIERAGFAWWKTYGKLRLVEALAAADRRAEAATELRTALDRARELGAGALVEQFEELARRARLPLEGVQDVVELDDLGLTPRETQVLGLVAEGLTNRQIGEALFITATTASVHISNILAKLDVTDRHEAAALARQVGLGLGR